MELDGRTIFHVDVNSASEKGVQRPAAEETGSISRIPPSRITHANANMMIWKSDTIFFVNK